MLRTAFARSPQLGLALGLIVLLGGLAAHVATGLRIDEPEALYRAFVAFDGSPAQVMVRTVLLPRALIAACVGAALAVAGSIMQALTRNPLAAPGLLGINAGAALLVVVAAELWQQPSTHAYAGFAFAGAALGAVLVYGLAATAGGLTPLKLTLAGAAISTFLSAVTQGLLVLNEETLDGVRLWLTGSVAGRDAGVLRPLLPYVGVGLLAAFALGRPLTVLALGEDVARSLGLRTTWVKTAGAAVVVLLAGSAVAAAGPVAFVGLFIPHLARASARADYRRLLPLAAVYGAAFLVLADLAARLVIAPLEVPVGIMAAAVGVPFLVHLARTGAQRL
ncbi:MAG TPA: iron ABC transporter permease [Bacillota bacterium]